MGTGVWASSGDPAGSVVLVGPGVAPGRFPDCVLWPQEGRGGTPVVSARCWASLGSEPQCSHLCKGADTYLRRIVVGMKWAQSLAW